MIIWLKWNRHCIFWLKWSSSQYWHQSRYLCYFPLEFAWISCLLLAEVAINSMFVKLWCGNVIRLLSNLRWLLKFCINMISYMIRLTECRKLVFSIISISSQCLSVIWPFSFNSNGAPKREREGPWNMDIELKCLLYFWVFVLYFFNLIQVTQKL
jgi:hypothetical protein